MLIIRLSKIERKKKFLLLADIVKIIIILCQFLLYRTRGDLEELDMFTYIQPTLVEETLPLLYITSFNRGHM